MKRKRIFTHEGKTIILRDHLENNISISELSEKYGIHPNAIYKWKKTLFEQAPKALARKSNKNNNQKSKDEQRITELEGKLNQRESLIAEIVHENIELKKNFNGEILKRNGLSLK